MIWWQFYYPFKGDKDGLLRYKTHWNFTQSSTNMLTKRFFGMFKGRFQIYIFISFWYTLDLLMACTCLATWSWYVQNGLRSNPKINKITKSRNNGWWYHWHGGNLKNIKVKMDIWKPLKIISTRKQKKRGLWKCQQGYDNSWFFSKKWLEIIFKKIVVLFFQIHTNLD